MLKLKVKRAVSYISDFGRAIAREAGRRGLDGVVCGHIHHAEMCMIEGVLYCNDGDWVESLTALVEHADGRLELLDWSRPHVDEPMSRHLPVESETPVGKRWELPLPVAAWSTR